ncbi:IclR family transcriptional regulator [Arthrobacter psychrochitiniphilus]|uniref:IclR family transcriptional regulator n=2 Tax=Arthrobacter psychrochitiniphilus TaxID=291045 RepID=A0A2V3DP29_9MICC|nr:IclR family transcriptional regulator [Arthrobacter psychrochitiniphilus]
MDDGFVVHLSEERKYELDVTAHELGTGYTRQVPLQRLARSPLAQLVGRTKLTAHLAVMRGRQVNFLIEEQAELQSVLVTKPGVRLPAHLTASGRAMLAAMSSDQLVALCSAPEAVLTRYDTDIQSMGGLNALLRSIRERVFFWEQDEVTNGFSSLAVPVFDRSGVSTAGVTLTVANRSRLSPAELGKNAASGTIQELIVGLDDLATNWWPEVKRCAAEISRRLRPNS